MADGAPLVLASASPRRRDLLRAAGVAFDVRPTDVPEDLPPGLDPRRAARALAQRKARAAAAREPAGTLVLGADTVVAVRWDAAPGEEPPRESLPGADGWLLLGKPEGAGDARAMLRRLSGTRHQVVTGVCARRAGSAHEVTAAERTWVRMRELSAAEVDAYAASGEWRGKAGGYAIQESADAFVTGLEEGGFDNVVGLPVALALRLLAELGWRPQSAPGPA